MISLQFALLGLLAIGASTPSPREDLVAVAKLVPPSATDSEVKALLARLGDPRAPSYMNCDLGCQDSDAKNATLMGLIWMRGDPASDLASLHVGFCRKAGVWRVHDVTVFEPGRLWKLTGKGDWTEVFRSQSARACEREKVPLANRYSETAKSLVLGGAPEAIEPTTLALGRPDGVTFYQCGVGACAPTAEREATMMAVRWGREEDDVQAELTLVFCGGFATWQLASIHVVTRPATPGAFGTERPVTEVFRNPKEKRGLASCRWE